MAIHNIRGRYRYVEGAVMAWAVLAPTNKSGPGLLAGTYVGATGIASVGVGVGANVLFGGFGNSISLHAHWRRSAS